jgi:uncharacterized protein YciI
MLWLITRVINPRNTESREPTLPKHREYLHSKKDILLLSGPMQDDGGTESIGSVFIVNVNTRAEAKAFLDGDPFAKTGHYMDEKIIRMRKGSWNPSVAESA